MSCGWINPKKPEDDNVVPLTWVLGFVKEKASIGSTIRK